MYYFIDGYNLLFSWNESHGTLHIQRGKLIRWIQKEFGKMSLQGAVVFDGAHKRGEESGLSYPSPLEVAYTPKGQTADQYILEQIEGLKNRRAVTVVTNDLGLRRHARCMEAKTQSNESFLSWLLKRSKMRKAKPRTITESPQQIKRLLEIFEDRLNKEEEW